MSHPLLTAAAAAQRAWERAGLERRLRVLQDAGRRLAGERAALLDALRTDGLSTAMAEYWAEWIVHAADPKLLEGYARASLRWVRGELLVRRPDGVVLLVPPANSPTINASSVFSILLPGNAAVVRAPPHNTGVRFLVEGMLHPALQAAGLPVEVAQVMTGRSRDFLGTLAPKPEVKTIVFFGNSDAGRVVTEQGAKAGKKVVLELEGSDHMALWKDAPLDEALESAGRALHASGQPCAVPKHFLVHGALHERFVQALVEKVQHAKPVEVDPAGGTLVPLGRPETFVEVVEEARSVGRLLTGGYRMTKDGTKDAQGLYAAPAVVSMSAEACLSQRLRCFDEEIFFPLYPVIRFDGTDEAILDQMMELLRRSPFGLRASLWTQEPKVMARFAAEIGGVGLLVLNRDHAHVPEFVSPWGGPGRSGGAYGESHFFWEKTSHLQAIACRSLSPAQLRAVLEALGGFSLVEVRR